ncbi:MAG: acyl-CoA dehydrogenase family protein [Nocardioidaceae bacterium]
MPHGARLLLARGGRADALGDGGQSQGAGRGCPAYARLAWCSVALGTAPGGARLRSLPYITERKAFGEPIACQSVAFCVADIAIELEGTATDAADRGFARRPGLAVRPRSRHRRRLCAEYGMKIGTDGSSCACGSDSAAISTTAVLDGDHYVLNGEKIYVTSGARSDAVVVWATLDKSMAAPPSSRSSSPRTSRHPRGPRRAQARHPFLGHRDDHLGELPRPRRRTCSATRTSTAGLRRGDADLRQHPAAGRGHGRRLRTGRRWS